MELTPEKRAQLEQLQTQLDQLEVMKNDLHRERVGLSGQLRRGVEQLQSTTGAAVEAVGDLTGIQKLREYGEEVRVRNALEAEQAAPPIRDLTQDPVGALADLAANVAPSLGAMGGAAGAGAVVGAPFGGLIGAGIGATIGLAGSAFGLNLGTIKEIQEAIDPEETVGSLSLAGAGAATVFDVATGFLATGAKRPFVESVKQAVKGQLEKDAVKEAGLSTAEGVLTTGGSVGALEVAGTLEGGRGFDQDRVEAMGENMATAMILSPAFIAPTSYASVALQNRAVRKQADANERGILRVDPETQEVIMTEPNSLAMQAPDVFKAPFAAMGLGRAVDEMVQKASGNTVVRQFAAMLDQTYDERVRNIGGRTVNTEAQLLKGDIGEIADLHTIKNMTKQQRRGLEDKIRNDVYDVPSNKVRDAFKFVKERAEAAGIKMGDLGDSYLPFMADAKKIRDDMSGFINEMTEAISTKRGYDKATPEGLEKIERLALEIADYAEQVTSDGAVRLADPVKVPDKLVEAMRLADEEGDFSKIRRPFVNIDRPARVNTNNNLERHRFLSEVEPATLQKWEKETDILEKLDLYSQLVSERIAYAERFGANNELLNEMVRRAIVEGIDNHRPLSATSVNQMYDMANLQQRITSKEVGPAERQMTKATKSVMNTLTLPLATVSSLLEMMFALPKTGPKSFIKGGMEAVRVQGAKAARLAGFKDMPRLEAERLLNEMNTSFREALVNTMARIGDDVRSQNITRYDQGFFRYNGLAWWTEFSRSWAQLAALDSFKELGAKVGDTSLSQRVRRDASQRLMEAGLDPNQVYQWTQRNASRQDPILGRELKAAAIDLAEDVIFNPKPVNKPTWASNPHWYTQFFGHLKTFPLQFNNRIILPTARRYFAHQQINSAGDIARNLDMQSALATTAMGALAITGFSFLDAAKTFAREGNLDKYNEKTAWQKTLTGLAQMGIGGMLVDSSRADSFGGSVTEVIAGPAISKPLSAIGGSLAVLTGQKEPEEVIEDTLTSLPSFFGSREAIKDAL